jgi:uncharacterized ferritin-like protein (DUF455 family)
LPIALAVLNEADPAGKVAAARAAQDLVPPSETGLELPGEFKLPERPARPKRPVLTAHTEVPRRRIGSAHGRIAMLHALAHIELNAIDLAFDMAARFAAECEDRLGLADEFAADWIGVGVDEAEHFELLQNRLVELGSFYGALNAHDGLWEAAVDTKDNWAARLAIVPMVLEARGLDVTPATVKGLRTHGDEISAEIMEKIYQDEIRHVAIGVKWFKRLCAADGLKDAEAFQILVAQYFKGRLKPPFNDKARVQAGLLPIFYRSRSQ